MPPPPPLAPQLGVPAWRALPNSTPASWPAAATLAGFLNSGLNTSLVSIEAFEGVDLFEPHCQRILGRLEQDFPFA